MEYVDVRVAMVILLLSVAALVVVFVLMLRKQKRMYVAQLEEGERHRGDLLNKYMDAWQKKKDLDEKTLQLSAEVDYLNGMNKDFNKIRLYQESEITNLTSHRKQLQEANKQLEERCNIYANMVAEREKEIEQQKEQIAVKDGDINEMNHRLIGFTAENVIHKNSIGNYKAEISGLKKQLAVQKGVITKLRKKLKAKEVPGE